MSIKLGLKFTPTISLLALMTFAVTSQARLDFRQIDGQTYYEILGLQPKASRSEIWAAYRSLKEKYSAELTGNEAHLRFVHEAFRSLEPPNVRAYYNEWLRTLPNPTPAIARQIGQSNVKKKNQEDFRAEVLQILFEKILASTDQMPQAEASELARLQIVTWQRLMPDGFIELEELYRLLTHYSLAEHSNQRLQKAQLALAGGVVLLLQERTRSNLAHDRDKSRFYLRSLRRHLRQQRNELADTERLNFLNQVEQLIDGLESSFSLNCQRALAPST